MTALLCLLLVSTMGATLKEIDHLSIMNATTSRMAVDEVNNNIFAVNSMKGSIDIISYNKESSSVMMRKSIDIKSASKSYFDLNDITDITYSPNGYVITSFTSSTSSNISQQFGWLGLIDTVNTKQSKLNDIRFLELKHCYTPKWIKTINNDGYKVIVGCDGKPNQHGSIIVIDINFDEIGQYLIIDLSQYIKKLSDKAMNTTIKPFSIVVDDKEQFAYITFKGNNVVAVLDILLMQFINIYQLDSNDTAPDLLMHHIANKNGKQYLFTLNEGDDIYNKFNIWQIIIDYNQNIPSEIRLLHSTKHNLQEIISSNAWKASSMIISTCLSGNKYAFIAAHNGDYGGIAVYEMNNITDLEPKFIEFLKYDTNEAIILNVISQENKDPFLIVATSSTFTQHSLITIYQLNYNNNNKPEIYTGSSRALLQTPSVCTTSAPPKCDDLVDTVSFWGRTATGIVIDSYTTDGAISFIGCNVGCSAGTFECIDTETSITFQYQNSPAAAMDLLWGPINAAPATLACAAAGNEQLIHRAIDDQDSVDALCQQLGYETGTFVSATANQGCPEPKWDDGNTEWVLDFGENPATNGASSITCMIAGGPQASCTPDMGECCGELVCENDQCCIPANYEGADCLDIDDNCCEGLFCAQDGKCKSCSETNESCNKNCDCCNESQGEVCRSSGTGNICQLCAQPQESCVPEMDQCCGELVCSVDNTCCVPIGFDCQSDSANCCGDLFCGNDDKCVAALAPLQCPSEVARCNDIESDSSLMFWGRAAQGIIIETYTNGQISFIGCNLGCTFGTFQCIETANSITFRHSQGATASMDLLWGPLPGPSAADCGVPPGPYQCADETEPSCVQRAPDDAVSVEALCQQLGYETGTFVSATANQGCSEPKWDGTMWITDFADNPQTFGANSITCSYQGPQAQCIPEMRDCCGELVCENNVCCIPANYNGAHCLDDDNNCCDGMICAEDGRCYIDIDECKQGTDNCHKHATCIDTAAGYRCECKPNWISIDDGVICLPPGQGKKITTDLSVNSQSLSDPVKYEEATQSQYSSDSSDSADSAIIKNKQTADNDMDSKNSMFRYNENASSSTIVLIKHLWAMFIVFGLVLVCLFWYYHRSTPKEQNFAHKTSQQFIQNNL